MKILAPAGNFESLRLAVLGGADEVYLGINEFNARNNIDGFDMTTLKRAVDFAHLFGVKVNLALNVLFSDSELLSAVNLAVEAYNMGVDSFIIQDLGLAKILQDEYPAIEKHASTQMGLHNLEGVKAVEKYNFRRIVLARETPLSEIKRIKENSDVEIEYFAHGALCVSFSGNCYMSSYLHNASGNRGRCKQLCRLSYHLLKDGKRVKTGYLLSAKDFNMLNRLPDLENAGVDVIKIEGRARRPYYVYATTLAYSRALSGQTVDEKSLLLAFNRGFTEGYFNGNDKIISKRQSHLGLKIGIVEKVKSGRTFNEVFIKTKEELTKKSTIKFLDENDFERAVVSAFDVTKTPSGYRITTTAKISVGDSAHLIADGKIEGEIVNCAPKRPLDIEIEIVENMPLKATFFIDGKEYAVYGDIALKANNRPLLEGEIKENFAKSDIFEPKIKIKRLDSVFVVKSAMNEFRRNALKEAEKILTSSNRKHLTPLGKIERKSHTFMEDFCAVERVDEAYTARAKNLVYSPETYDIEEVKNFFSACKNAGKKGYLDTPNFATYEDIKILKKIIEDTGASIVANNYYALTLADDYIVGGGLNVYNSATAGEYLKPIITAEDGIKEREDFPFMTLRHCPIKEHIGGDCSNCKYQRGYALKSEGGKVFEIKRKKLATCTFYLV